MQIEQSDGEKISYQDRTCQKLRKKNFRLYRSELDPLFEEICSYFSNNEEVTYNTMLSTARNPEKGIFGRLKSPWSIFTQKMDLTLENIPVVVYACVSSIICMLMKTKARKMKEPTNLFQFLYFYATPMMRR